MIDHPEPSADLPDPDEDSMPFYVFMLAFWPVSIILGLIDFYLVTDYDLRLYVLLAGLLAGALAVRVYRTRTLVDEEA